MGAHPWSAVRAGQWWHFLGLPLASLGRGQIAGGVGIEAVRVTAGVLVAGCCLAVAYGVNAVCERSTDRSADKNPLVAAPELTRATVRWIVGLASVGLLAAGWLGAWALIGAAVSMLAGLVYSASAWGKRAPVLGLVGNTLIFVPLLVLLHPGGELPAACVAELGLFATLLAQNQLLHERADVEEDAAAGSWTTARWLGSGGTTRVVAGLGGLGVVAAGLAVTGGAQVAGVAGVLGATAVGCLIMGVSPVRARRWHRWWALGCGAAVFVLQRA
jgi:4-hydroxybenzoate polyprenyltransferase